MFEIRNCDGRSHIVPTLDDAVGTLRVLSGYSWIGEGERSRSDDERRQWLAALPAGKWTYVTFGVEIRQLPAA